MWQKKIKANVLLHAIMHSYTCFHDTCTRSWANFGHLSSPLPPPSSPPAPPPSRVIVVHWHFIYDYITWWIDDTERNSMCLHCIRSNLVRIGLEIRPVFKHVELWRGNLEIVWYQDETMYLLNNHNDIARIHMYSPPLCWWS